jgi:DNA-binding response OmpR family regulator
MPQKNQPTVLVIEDDADLRHLIETILSQNGFVTVGYDSAESALKRIPSLKPAIILLDIQLPGLNGLECCKQIRSMPETLKTPIIFLSVHASDAYKITGLESGADDFIAKPFSHGELLARIRAILRRTQEGQPLSEQILKDAHFTLDPNHYTVLVDSKPVDLSPKEFSMLALFMKADGNVLSRDVISSQVWGQEHLDTSRTIDMHMARLRKKLGKKGKFIQTVGKIGYRYNPAL